MNIGISGFFIDCSGYGVATMRTIEALKLSGGVPGPVFSVTDGENACEGPGIEFAQGPICTKYAAHMIFAIAEQFPGMNSVKGPHIGFTTWETSQLHEKMVEGCKAVDYVMVPSRFNQQVFQDAGIRAGYLPFPVVAPTAPVTTPQELYGLPDETYVFYTIATWQDRKNLTGLLTTFLTTFAGNDGIELVVKTNGSQQYLEGEVSRLRHILNLSKPAPAVRIITRRFTEAELWGLHYRGDCFVSLTRGEAFGLPILDAAVVGKPIVVSGRSGHTEFLDGHPGVWYVSGRMAPVVSPYHLFSAEQNWFDPDLLVAGSLMREAMSHGRQQLYTRDYSELSPEVIGRKLMEYIQCPELILES